MITFINLTPHIINEIGTGMALPPSGTVARVAVSTVVVDTLMGVDIYATTYGDVVDLPDPRSGICFIVSGMVLNACQDRVDLLAPGELVRDDQGKPVGCKGFRRA